MTELHYIPLPEIEDETEMVRRALRKYGRRLQRQGEIPGDVSEAEIKEEVEKLVTGFLQSLHTSPLYPHLKEKGHKHLEEFLLHVISTALSAVPIGSPDLAADQA